MALTDIISIMRPRQWTKNLALFAGIIFAGRLFDLTDLVVITCAFAAFCLVSSAVYAFNDICDAERDRSHPIKRLRPVASGRMSVAAASGVVAVLGVSGLGASLVLGTGFFAVVVGYVAVQVAYALGLKHVHIVDMLVISSGFVLRAVAGAVVIAVPVSPWLIGCTGLLALFLASAKRRHEVVLLRGSGGAHRPVLTEYSAELLDSFMVTLSASTITSYALYTFFQSQGRDFVMMLTIPFVIYGILRYQHLVLRKDAGGRPEDVLFGDKPILIDVVLWAASVVFVLYVAPHLIR